MDTGYCSVCGKQMKESDSAICPGCGERVCIDDYDGISGYCVNCSDNYPFYGC